MAKTRAELPWLYYPKSDTVRVLNSQKPGGGSGVVYESHATTQQTSRGVACNAAKPSGVVSGDLLIAFATTRRNGSASHTVSGWTQVSLQNQANLIVASVWYKIAGPSEPSTYAFDHSASGSSWIVTIVRFSGHDPSTPINVFGLETNNNTSPQSPSITTTVANCLLLRLLLKDQVGSEIGTATGQLWNYALGSGSDVQEQAGALGLQVSAGSSGSFTWSLANARNNITYTVAIAPA